MVLFGTNDRNTTAAAQSDQADAMANFLNKVPAGDLVNIETITNRLGASRGIARLQPPGTEPWPLENDPGPRQALAYLGAQDSRLGSDPRPAYWIQPFDKPTWNAIATKVEDVLTRAGRRYRLRSWRPSITTRIRSATRVPGATEAQDGDLVIIRLASGTFAAYGQLRPDSVRVHAGDRVRTGQVLGQLGNSGNMTGALH